MNATKRKFNALLTGLGNKSTTSLDSTINTDTSANVTSTSSTDDIGFKKRRIAQTFGTPAKHPLGNVRTPLRDSSLNLKNHRKSYSVAQPHQSTEKPKYAPWDRDAFLERLKSFSNLTDWAPKPARVNEVEWAKRGWTCQKSERVRCCLCNVEILVKLNKKEVDGKEQPVYVASQIEDALVSKYAEMIISSHAEHCLWRQRGCDETIFKLPLNHAPTTLEAIRNSYDGLCALSHLLPYMHNLRLPEGFDLDTIISYLPTGFFTPNVSHPLNSSSPAVIPISSSEAPPINHVAFLLALFGWHTRPGSLPSHGTASCKSCFRNLGLWLFRSKEVSEAGEETRPASMAYLDVVAEHRDYCPWRNRHNQSGGGKQSSTGKELAAWEIVLRVLKNDHYLRRDGDAEPAKRKRPLTVIEGSGVLADPFQVDGAGDDSDAKSIREDKDKERWARLRRVKSLFDTKGSKRLNRAATNEKEKST